MGESNQEYAALKQALEEARKQIATQQHELEERADTIEYLQSLLMKSDKMAVLGELAPAIIHEINAPLGVIKGASQLLQNRLPKALKRLPVFLERLSEDKKQLFWQYFTRLTDPHRPPLNTTDERKYERVLLNALEDADIDEAEDYAEKMIKFGLYNDYEPLIPLLQDDATGGDWIELLSTTVLMIRKVYSIETAVDNAQRIVRSLKNYVYQSDHSAEDVVVGDALVESNITDSIDAVMFLYEYHVAKGLKLNVHYHRPLPKILALPDTLSQVWSNLITNAIHALDGQGQIDVEVLADETDVIVRVRDNGPGIPKDIQDRIFESLFTTKKRGEGTGLGLSLCQKIVDKHNGTINFSSEPGNTVFEVRIPRADRMVADK